MMFNASFEKKTLCGAILSLLFGVGILLYPFFIYALGLPSSWNIDFESSEGYSIGDLNTQNNWSGDTNFDITNEGGYFVSGSQGIKYNYAGSSNYIQWTAGENWDTSSEDNIYLYSIWLKTGSVNQNFNMSFGFIINGFEAFLKTLPDQNYYNIQVCAHWFNCNTKAGLGFNCSNYLSGDWTTYTGNSWHQIIYKIDTINNLVWLEVDDHKVSELTNTCFWFNTGRTDLTLSNLHLRSRGDNTAFDRIHINFECSSDNCYECPTSDTCQAAGCIWEYNTGFERWECHPEWIAYVYGCGLGQCGCPDQTTCEAAEPIGTCEWVDRGYGYGCYEVEEAPPEAEWEVPELEDCDVLSGVEKWLCIIKNFIASIFMPTQEKVDNLKKTIDNFKAKFPFNYAAALSAFFTTIKTSFDTEKNIPIEVLGVESNVDFSFWDQNTTIGGTTETLKNVLFDITTAFIIIAFSFWIISFIKRIF